MTPRFHHGGGVVVLENTVNKNSDLGGWRAQPQKDMVRINCTLYEFLSENMRTGISNMEYIHEMML